VRTVYDQGSGAKKRMTLMATATLADGSTAVCTRVFERTGSVPSTQLRVQKTLKELPKIGSTPKAGDPDFTGKWQLSNSTNFDEYLEALGVNWAKRRLAAGMKPVQDWVLIDGTWQFTVQSPAGPRTEVFPIGVQVDDNVDGTAVLKTSKWEGPVLFTGVTAKDPKMATRFNNMAMRRYLLQDGSEVKLILEMIIGDIVCTREFSRTSGPVAAVPVAPGTTVPAREEPEADPDFTGTWQLSESHHFDEYLEAMQVNWAKRRIAAGMKPVQTWVQKQGTWQFTVQAPTGPKVEAFPIDTPVADDVDGTKMTKTTKWQGGVLHTDVEADDPVKAKQYGKMAMRRYLLGTGPDQKLVLEMIIGDITCMRIFSKIG